MDSQKIEALLERYWACETSLEEERFLNDFFAGADIPESLSESIPFFAWKQENAKIRTSAEFSKKIEKIGAGRNKKQQPIVKYLYPAMKIAASILIVVTVGLGIHTHNQNQEVLQQVYSETYTDPQQALEEVCIAFDKIGSSLNKAQTALDGIADTSKLDTEE